MEIKQSEMTDEKGPTENKKQREPGYKLMCPKCGQEMSAGYTAKTMEELLQRERPDFWGCVPLMVGGKACNLFYQESETGELREITWSQAIKINRKK